MSFLIKTERLIIRDIQKMDIPILLSQYAEPISQKNILSYQTDKKYNLQKLKKDIFWTAQSIRLNYNLAVILKNNHRLIGSCEIGKDFSRSTEAFIGWHFGSKFWGNGYATEAAGKLLFVGFELLKVGFINADCFENNRASIRIMEKIGMTPLFDNIPMNKIRALFYGETKPTVRYCISKNQWLNNSK